MEQLYQLPIWIKPNSPVHILVDAKTLVEFVIDLGKKHKEGVIRMPKSMKREHVNEIRKLKYHALAINDEGEIEALHYSNRKVKGIYPITVVAKGKKEVAALIEEDGLNYSPKTGQCNKVIFDLP